MVLPLFRIVDIGLVSKNATGVKKRLDRPVAIVYILARLAKTTKKQPGNRDKEGTPWHVF